MIRNSKKLATKFVASIMSLVLVVGLVPLPAFAASGKSASNTPSTLVAGSGNLEVSGIGRMQAQNGSTFDDSLGPLEIAIAKSLAMSAASGLTSGGFSWGAGKLLTAMFGNTDPKVMEKLNEILAELNEIESAINELQTTVNGSELDTILNSLIPVLNDRTTYDVYNSLKDVSESSEDDAAKQLVQSKLTDELKNGSADKPREMAADNNTYDEFTWNLWLAMTHPYKVNINGAERDLTLMQVWYEHLRYKYRWEHQAYEEWAQFQGQCVSLLATSLALEKASLQTRIELIEAHNAAHPNDLVSDGAIQNRLATIQDCINQMAGYTGPENVVVVSEDGGSFSAHLQQVDYPGLFNEKAWAEQYWMYKERPDYRYYWVPGHEILFYAKVNTQDVPQEPKNLGLVDDQYLKGIKVSWRQGSRSVFDIYDVKINYDFWKPFLRYQGGDAPLVSVDQLKQIYKDYGSDTHLYDIFIGKNQGNFLGLEEGEMEHWWFVVDQDKGHHLTYKKHTTKADELYCYVVESKNAKTTTADLCKYHRSSHNGNKHRHYIGIGVARVGAETYNPGKMETLPSSAAQVHTAVDCDCAQWWPARGKFVVSYDGSTQGKVVSATMDGKKIAAKNYSAKNGKFTISKAYMEKLGYGKHKLVLQTAKGVHTVTFKSKRDQAVTVANTLVTKTFGDAGFKISAQAKKGNVKLTYASSNKKVASVSAKGKVTIRGGGIAKITVGAAETAKYVSAKRVVTLKVKKAENPVSLAGKTIAIKHAELEGAEYTAPIARAQRAQGKVTYSITKAVKGEKNFKKQFSINKKTGKITVAKGLAKGAYKVTVKAKAAGNANYKSGYRTAVVTVKVT